MRTGVSTFLRVLLFTIVLISLTRAQSWDDGMYHNGRDTMDWRGSDQLYTVSGKIIVDSSFTTTNYMGNMRPAFYYLDTTGTGSKDYQLFFGPYWYKPTNGTTKPVEGDSVSLTGIKMISMTPPMLSVYIIDGNLWRDTVGVESWSGGWIHNSDTDSSKFFCPTDSMSFMHLGPNSMGTGMMGMGGMQWPDSIFCQFEEMTPDSMPNNSNSNSIMGYHLAMYDSIGNTMMQMGSMNNGKMTMKKSVNLIFHIPQDSLNGKTMSQISCQYMDNNGNWNTVTAQVNSQDNTLLISQADLYSYYRIVPTGTTPVENGKNSLPANYTLEQNYPNPFNPSTIIKYSLPSESFVSLKVYDLLGREVRTLVNKVQKAGVQRINFNASDLPSGVYIYTLSTNRFTQTKKLVLLK
ncbi:MAG TPA: T9SS type A sorting domain-containing protein [Ignavibacteriaceae bacterium]|nr:T9SS type A sorting domain-containing protein [Ignavibacteriaceae bacterium]